MNAEQAISELEESYKFFKNSSKVLSEEDSGFSPAEGVMTVAQQFAHLAQTIDWFMEPLDKGGSFNMNFEPLFSKVLEVTSLVKAREWLDKSITGAVEVLRSKGDSLLEEKLPEGPIMGGQPKICVVSGILDHNAHHRGALAVYSRLIGKVPPIPYGDF